jgi:hypothetical protein
MAGRDSMLFPPQLRTWVVFSMVFTIFLRGGGCLTPVLGGVVYTKKQTPYTLYLAQKAML